MFLRIAAPHKAQLKRPLLRRSRFRQRLSASVVRLRSAPVELTMCHASRLSEFAT